MSSLRRAMESTGCLVVPGVYDCVSARIAESVGFPAVVISGASVSSSRLGLPDLGFLGLSDITAAARAIVSSVSVPVICDADAGYGGSTQVWETVRQFEAAGVAGLHLEDQASPKRCGFLDNRPVVEIEEMESKLEAALAARRDDDLVIIARSDAKEAEGVEGVIRRLKRYMAVGADVAFAAEQYTEEEIAAIAGEVGGPLAVCTGTPGQTTAYASGEELAALGVSLALHPFSSLYSAARAMRDLHVTLLGAGAMTPELGDAAMMTFDGFNDIMGLAEWEARGVA